MRAKFDCISNKFVVHTLSLSLSLSRYVFLVVLQQRSYFYKKWYKYTAFPDNKQRTRNVYLIHFAEFLSFCKF